MADVLCPICGRPNSEHREFCDFCGNPLDGALRVEGDSGLTQDDLLDNLPPESMDDDARLDSLIPATEDEIPPSRLDDLKDEEPLNGDSRLDSLLSDEFEEPTQLDDGYKETLNGGSRLDDYLPIEEPTPNAEPESLGEDDSYRLDEYLSPEEPKSDLPLDVDSLSTDQEDDSTRLDDYLTPESPEYQDESSDDARLDDFFADDPFKEPDPFQEPSASDEKEEDPFSLGLDPFAEPPGIDREPASTDQGPAEEPSFQEDDFLSFRSLEQPPEEPASPEPTPDTEDLSSLSPTESNEWDFLDPTLKPDQPEEEEPAESFDAGEWDFLDPTPKPEQPAEEEPVESFDAGEWDFLDPTPKPEQPADDSIPESADADERDFLDSTPTPEQPEVGGAPESADADEWDFLDSTPTPEQPEVGGAPESADANEWDFLDSTPTPEQPEVGGAPESADAEEWDFLDPTPTAADQKGVSSTTDSGEPEDWSFLDPGPAADLPEGAGEGEFTMEGDGEDAGWLDMLQDPESRQRLEEETGPLAEPQKPQTDWLDKIKRLNKSSDLVDEDSSFPDWLSVTGKTAEFKGDAAGEGEEASGDVPDWLQLDDDESLNEFLRKKDLTNEEYKPKITTDSLDEAEVITDKDAPDAELSDSQQIKFPSWAEEEKKKGQKPRVVGAEQGADETLKGSAEPFQIEEEFFDDLFSEELPGWLTATSSEEVSQSLGENLAQAELPGWVEAMRPVVESSDASGLDDDEEYIENYGPLAGIPSVLPAEAEIGIDLGRAVQKPLDLQATKKHHEYVTRLEKLIEDENKSKTILLPAPMQTQRVLRWLIAILMLVAVAGTMIFTTAADAAPLISAQVQGTGFGALYEEIETLYDGQPVLIAFDYQPAAAGELHTAAATVVDHLMEQGTFLTFVSTQPTGPALAEHFLDTTQSHHNYIHTQKYINLGYLPGESSGLLSFMINPQKIIPLAFDGSNAWDSPPLISIDNISDFKMILVITDDPNTAKIWIEQVGSRLAKTPLTMVVSAQVEPLIQPYFRTSPRLLSGYVAGIIDSMNYERLTERPFLANKIWLPFNIGIVISVGIIFISGLANGVLSLFSRRKEEKLGESK